MVLRVADALVRCEWAANADPLNLAYHDEEWGVPSRDDRHLFELLILEGAQAALSWSTILRKRDGYRRAFAGFDVEAVARFNEHDVDRLVLDTGIVRNRAKIEATIANASAALSVRDQFGGLSAYLWQFVASAPRQNAWRALNEIPAQTDESRAMSKDLRQRGFKFVGPTICYALMQAAGLVNDHTTDCFRYSQLSALGKK
jgi:DNA-3-methyladenine glycosylase I